MHDWVSLDFDSLTAYVIRIMQDNGYRVSVFANPGSLLGTVPAFVAAHAVRGEQKHVLRVDQADHAEPTYVCVCRLAESLGIDFE